MNARSTRPPEETTGAVVIDGQAARRLVADGARLIDVRTPNEFAAGHVDGAVNIPLQDLEAGGIIGGEIDTPVVLYCRSGRRSAIAGKILAESGHTAVYDFGAMSAW